MKQNGWFVDHVGISDHELYVKLAVKQFQKKQKREAPASQMPTPPAKKLCRSSLESDSLLAAPAISLPPSKPSPPDACKQHATMATRVSKLQDQTVSAGRDLSATDVSSSEALATGGAALVSNDGGETAKGADGELGGLVSW